jgi:hypothetical protein
VNQTEQNMPAHGKTALFLGGGAPNLTLMSGALLALHNAVQLPTAGCELQRLGHLRQRQFDRLIILFHDEIGAHHEEHDELHHQVQERNQAAMKPIGSGPVFGYSREPPELTGRPWKATGSLRRMGFGLFFIWFKIGHGNITAAAA